MQRHATLSLCGRYRYVLGRKWGEGPLLVVCMLNPSKADANLDDPTATRVIGFAQRGGYGSVLVVNLRAWRATDPREAKYVLDVTKGESPMTGHGLV